MSNYEKIYIQRESYPHFYLDRFISKFVLTNASSLPEEDLRQAFQELINEAITKSEEEAKLKGILGKVYKIT